MSKTSKMSRRGFVAGASTMAALAFAGAALAEEAPAGEGAPEGEGGEGGPEGQGGGEGGGQGGGQGGSTMDVEAARAAAKAENRSFGYSGVGDWLGEPETLTVAREIDDFDVVVIGGGHAGVQATLAAAEAGAKVALCEKKFAMTFLGEDVAAWNAQFNQDAGFPAYNLGEVINEFTTRGGGRVSQEVVASYVNNSGATLDHMLECMKNVVENDDARAVYDQLVEDTMFSNEYVAGGTYEQDLDETFYTYDVTRNGKILVQAMFDAEKVHELTDDVDWDAIAVDPDCETTEEGYQAGYQALYDTLASFYDNNNQCIDHTGYPKAPGTKTWATTVQFMGHFHGREGHGGVAASSCLGTVEMACLATAAQNGAEVFMGYQGLQVVQDADGKITGVICYDSDADEYVQFNCKAVVSCGGGYVQNSDMCWALLNELMETYERAGGLKEDFNGGGMAASADGSGVKMCCWAGGFVDPSPRGHMHLGGGPSGTWGCNCHLWLDENLERFCNEGNITAAGSASSRKTGKTYGIIGGDYLKHIATCGLEHTGPNFGRPEYLMDLMYDIETGAVDSQISVTGMTTAERMGSGIVKASSLESLAELLGVEDTEGFVAAVEAYNELCYGCQDGTYTCDPQFGKAAEAMIPIEGPLYYGFSGSLGASGSAPSMVTMSGVMTDKNLCVTDSENAPIAGLYAAGNDLGGRYGLGYGTPAAGNSIGMAVTNGRVAGGNAAAYALA
jgi:succinate dehydrogenase/fumarate reductase flavoprotein subunit